MRARRSLLAVAVSGGLALSLSAGPAGAGADNTLVVTKVVEGNVPPGTTFTIDVTCEGESMEIQDFEFEFGADGGSDSATVNAVPQECTVTESESGSASAVSYACEVIEPGPGEAECLSDRTFSIPGSGGGAEIEFTVTNTFEEPPPPPPQPAAAPEPVAAAPTFTG